MRYFKYKNTKQTEKNAEKQRYKNLTKKQKRAHLKEKIFRWIGTIVLFSVMIVCMIAFGSMIEKINPDNEGLILKVVQTVAKGILYLFAGLLSIIAGALASIPFFNKAGDSTREFTRQELTKACEHLREYYGLCEPCLVTKCYKSSEKRFDKHDVCIFFAGGELRITTNLKDGFFHAEKDLGCYCFRADEISVSKVQGEKFLIAELRVGDTFFELGYRAKGFIEKNFISNGEEK